MSQETTLFEPLVREATELLNAGFELYTCKITKKGASLSTHFIYLILIVFVGLISFCLMTLGLSLFLGAWLQNLALGFFVVAASLIIGLILIWSFKLRIKKCLYNYFIHSAFQ